VKHRAVLFMITTMRASQITLIDTVNSLTTSGDGVTMRMRVVRHDEKSHYSVFV